MTFGQLLGLHLAWFDRSTWLERLMRIGPWWEYLAK